MSLKLIRWENETVTPAHDSMQWDDGRIGILNGCNITHIGTNLLRISAGYIVVLGRLIEVTQTDVNCQVSSSGSVDGQMVLRIDLSSSTPLEIVTEASASLTPLTQDENFNFDNGIYEIQLATYEINETTLSNLDVKLQAAPSLGAEIQQLNNNLTSLLGKKTYSTTYSTSGSGSVEKSFNLDVAGYKIIAVSVKSTGYHNVNIMGVNFSDTKATITLYAPQAVSTATLSVIVTIAKEECLF